jgi:TRAP-type C4-dicarboxylate transport system substrate-binding protein
MENKLKLICYIILLMFLIMVGPPSDANASSPGTLIKFATVAPEGSTWMKQMRTLDKKIRSETGNRLGFAFYPGGVAGDEIDVLKKIRIGQIHCAAFSGVGFGQILPMVRVLDLPFLFADYDEADLVHGRMKEFFAKEFRSKGFELLSWAEVGNVHVFSKRPVYTLADLKGAKIWAWSGDPVARETFVQMGITPISLPLTDVSTGLNTGMIDTVYAPPLGALALQWHSSLSHMSGWPLVHSTGAVLISSRFIQGLSPDHVGILSKELEAAMKELTLELRRQTLEAVDIIKKAGVTVSPPASSQDLKDFRKLHDKVASALSDNLYPAALLRDIYRILRRTD